MAGGMWRRAGGGEASLKTQTNESHWKLLKRSAPYLWPRDALRAQAAFVGAIAVLLATNAVQLLTPFQLAHGVQRAADESAEPAETRSYSAIAVPVLAYVLLRFGSDFLVELRQYLFQVVSAETERRIALETFSHLQNLSLSFHLQRETGAVLRSVTRGAASFSTISQLLLFQIAPVFIQLIVVCIIFLVRFPWFFSVLVLVAVAVYFVVTFVAAEWRNKFRREMNTRENEYNQRAVEGLLNFETVKYFNAERHERNRVNRALVAYQKANLKSALALSTLNLGQATVIGASLAAAMLLAARQVSSGHMGVGDFVLVNQFLLTLFQPLNYLGSYYRLFKQAMIDVESMFELLGKPVDIVDVPAAPSLQVKGGHIEFDNVHFAYREERPILRGVSFVVRPGEHVAVVGKSGAGKSTLARLLYRFYDPQRGRILVDGQDVRSVTQLSLRRAIAIVPQDCVLFNDSIAYNVNYGRVGGEHAEAEEARLGPEVEPPIDQAAVETATRHAALHEFILSSQEGYRTPVGERGLRLSGGEKQRVAIARAILKAPNIIVLDEATSSLDTHTEREIQAALDEVCRGRTTLTIAHRLSTVVNSDRIIVLKEGQVVESGRHEELLAKGETGEYYRMWQRQQRDAVLKEQMDRAAAALREGERTRRENGDVDDADSKREVRVTVAAQEIKSPSRAAKQPPPQQQQPPPPPAEKKGGGEAEEEDEEDEGGDIELQRTLLPAGGGDGSGDGGDEKSRGAGKRGESKKGRRTDDDIV